MICLQALTIRAVEFLFHPLQCAGLSLPALFSLGLKGTVFHLCICQPPLQMPPLSGTFP